MDANDMRDAAAKAIQAVDVKKLKAGSASSELYVVVGTILSSLATAVLGIPIPSDLMVSLVGLAAAYLGSRTLLKVKSK